ncbi:MAG: DUF975 family protein [Bifidobacterium pseudocatenulatum]
MFVENVFLFLWSLTIVGFFIKQYSYRMVPYIVAENPNIEALDAIRLSRRMMKGHKWECFVADCSFLGWYLLNLITFGGAASSIPMATMPRSSRNTMCTCVRWPRLPALQAVRCSTTNTCTSRPSRRRSIPRTPMSPNP